jgi:hypothetical protein
MATTFSPPHGSHERVAARSFSNGSAHKPLIDHLTLGAEGPRDAPTCISLVSQELAPPASALDVYRTGGIHPGLRPVEASTAWSAATRQPSQPHALSSNRTQLTFRAVAVRQSNSSVRPTALAPLSSLLCHQTASSACARRASLRVDGNRGRARGRLRKKPSPTCWHPSTRHQGCRDAQRLQRVACRRKSPSHAAGKPHRPLNRSCAKARPLQASVRLM